MDVCIANTMQIVDSFHGHDDITKWKHFPRYWPFVWGIHRSPVNSPHKSQWHGALMFSLIYAWTLGKQSRRRWFETPSRSFWRHRSGLSQYDGISNVKIAWVIYRFSFLAYGFLLWIDHGYKYNLYVRKSYIGETTLLTRPRGSSTWFWLYIIKFNCIF